MVASRDYAIGEVDILSPHIPTVAKWLNEEWGISQGYDLSETMAWCNHLANAKNETILVATRKDRLIGTVVVVECDLEGHEHLRPWLSSLYVPIAERGKTIAKLLIQAACDWARQKRCSNLHIYARKGRLTAYYKRLGWERMSEFDVDGETFQIMQKPLSGARRES